MLLVLADDLRRFLCAASCVVQALSSWPRLVAVLLLPVGLLQSGAACLHSWKRGQSLWHLQKIHALLWLLRLEAVVALRWKQECQLW